MIGRSSSATAARCAIDAVLVRTVVIRRHVQRGVGAGLLGIARQLDRVGRIVRSAAGDDRHPAPGDLDRDLDHPAMLVGRERRRLAGRSARNQRIDALGDLPLDELANVSSATRPPENGVTSAGIEPKNMNLPPRPGVFCGEVGRVHWLIRSGTAKCPACGAPLFSFRLLVGTVSASAQYSAPYAYRPAPTYSAPAVSYAIADWRRLRQSNGYSFASYANFLVANPGWPGETNHAPMGRTSDAPGRKRRPGARLLRRRTSRRAATALPGSPMLMRPAGG